MTPHRRNILAHAAAAVVFLALAVGMTWPLGRFLRSGIPFTDRPAPGAEVLPLVEGDHLQLYYHYWLFHDALYGSTAWFRDPYEFHGDPVFRRFTTQRVPDSAIAAALSLGGMPLGYNLWVLLTTVAAVVGAVLLEFHPPRGVGIALLPGSASVYEGQTEGTTLALPIWPGDSSPSSVYLYYATESRSRLVNGYSPIVSKAYVERVFEPLYGADFGEWTPAMGELLRELDVRRVILHEDRFPDRLSPFGPGVAFRRTFETPVLVHEVSEGPLHRFRVADPPPAEASWAPAQSALELFLKAANLPGNGGASADAADALGTRVARPRPGLRDGFLVGTPRIALPGGSYRARFRLRLIDHDGSDGPVALVRARDGDRVLAERAVHAADLETGAFAPVDLPFSIEGTAGVSWTVWREPGGEFECDGILVMTDPALPADRVEAESSRYQGWTEAAPWASGGRVVVGGGRGFPRGGIMAAGPRRLFGPGRYRAETLLAGPAGNGAGDPARIFVRVVDAASGEVVGAREATVGNRPGVESVGFDLELVRDRILDLEVRYLDGGSCFVDLLCIVSADEGAEP